MPGYEGLVPGYKEVSAGVQRSMCRGTKRLVPGYKEVCAGVRRGIMYWFDL